MVENTVLARSRKGTRKALGDIGNTKLHELISDGRLVALKLDGRTLITEDSIQRLAASLLPAPIRAGQKK